MEQPESAARPDGRSGSKNGGRLVQRCGDAGESDVGKRPGLTTIVAVPGLGLSAAVPARAMDRLPHPTAVIELPAFGLPAPRGTALDPDRLAGLLLDRLDTVGGPVVLVGHSASCQIVAEAAHHAPHQVTGLVLLGPTTDPQGRSWPALAARWLRTAVHERPGQIPQLVHDYTRTGLDSMRRGMAAARRHHITHTLAVLRCPVLIVRGRSDRIAPADWTSSLADTTLHGRALTLPDGAHMLPITHPAAVAAVIEEFLKTP